MNGARSEKEIDWCGPGQSPIALAEGVGFEPTVRLPARLISSQVPSTTQPPFPPQCDVISITRRINASAKIIQQLFECRQAHLRRALDAQKES